MDKTLWYLCFTLSQDEDEAARRFEEKFGQPPEVIEEDKGIIWLGPIPTGSVRAGGEETGYIGHTRAVGED